MEEKNEEIKKGSIDYYYSLQIDTKMDFYEICECINKKIQDTIDKCNLENILIFKEDIEKFLKEHKDDGVNINLKIENVKKQIKKRKLNPDLQKLLRIELDTTDRGIMFYPIFEAVEEIKKMEQEEKESTELFLDIYGESFVNNFCSFVLPPFKAEMINGTCAFIKSVLYIFKNNAIILKLSVPIENCSMNPLFENDENKYIKNVFDVYEIGNIRNDKVDLLMKIRLAYCNYIISSSKKIKKLVVLNKNIRNIVLAKFDGMPENVNNKKDSLQEKLYRIIVSPVQKRNETFLRNIAKQYLAENSKIYDGIEYIINSMGKCLSIIDKNTINYIKERCNEKEDQINEIAINTIRRNVEYVLIMLLLKNSNNEFSYINKKIHLNNINAIQEKYYYNNLFLLQLQESCFGSVREQLEFFEERMIYFMDQKNKIDRDNAFDNIINSRKNIRTFKFQNFISIGGLIATIVFSMPAIYDTLTILRNSNLIIKKDIPIITIEICSVIVWIVLCLIMFGICFFKIDKIKMKYNKKRYKN